MKKLMRTVVLTLIFTFCLGMPVSAQVTGITAENFDYDWYVEQHPDIASYVDINDHEAVWNFYQTAGTEAGWLGRKTKISYYTKQNFDFAHFAENNPDVIAVYGMDEDAIFDWFLTIGCKENRNIRTTSEKANARIKVYEIASQITNNSMSTREKVKAVHDWLCINVAYDTKNYYAGTIPAESYSIAGPVLYGKAVCDGYASAFQFFMDILGIKSEKVDGTVTNSSGTTGGHAWNRVKIDGQWLYVDVTWDDPIPDRPHTVYRYTYFLISESEMNAKHRVAE